MSDTNGKAASPVLCECCESANNVEWCTDAADDDVVVPLCSECRDMLSTVECPDCRGTGSRAPGKGCDACNDDGVLPAHDYTDSPPPVSP